jgi:hypothetical protein
VVSDEELLTMKFVQYVGMLDWGFAKPGCFLVFGITEGGDAVIVAETYRSGQTIGWWGQRATEYHNRYGLSDIVCDPENAEGVNVFDSQYRLPVSKAKKDVVIGIAVVAQAIKAFRLRYYRNANTDMQEDLVNDKKPASFLDEIQGYQYDPDKADYPADGQEDHAMDAARYGCMRVFGEMNVGNLVWATA